MDIIIRRKQLITIQNPDPGIDYAITIAGEFSFQEIQRPSKVVLSYVPDKRILEPTAFHRYLKSFNKLDWNSLEHAAVTILDDINNEVVGRWVRIDVTIPKGENDRDGLHRVLLVDQQPNWDNPALLALI